jgi:DUF2934 family protein
MPSHNEIERRAYDLYEQQGREDGHDCDDSFLAEAQLRLTMRDRSTAIPFRVARDELRGAYAFRVIKWPRGTGRLTPRQRADPLEIQEPLSGLHVLVSPRRDVQPSESHGLPSSQRSAGRWHRGK